MVRTITADLIYQTSRTHTLIDVRSPAEFAAGHIPGAQSVPLFSDQQRAIVGTLYVQKGREEAIKTGLEIVGSQLAGFVEALKAAAPRRKVLVYCWRGGMRSKSVASLLDSLGFDTLQLIGGYKAFRAHNREQFAQKRNFVVLSGKTGSGKTVILKELAKQNQQIIDLEGLAHHKGSVFGAFEQTAQPSQEQFENELGWSLTPLDSTQITWLEDESRMIGRCAIPEELWLNMRQAPRVVLDVPDVLRKKNLLSEYGAMPPELVSHALDALEKHVGSERARMLRAHLDQPEFVLDHLLDYYDKTYAFSAHKRATNYPNMQNITITQDLGMDRETLAQVIIEKTLKIFSI